MHTTTRMYTQLTISIKIKFLLIKFTDRRIMHKYWALISIYSYIAHDNSMTHEIRSSSFTYWFTQKYNISLIWLLFIMYHMSSNGICRSRYHTYYYYLIGIMLSIDRNSSRETHANDWPEYKWWIFINIANEMYLISNILP